MLCDVCGRSRPLEVPAGGLLAAPVTRNGFQETQTL